MTKKILSLLFMAAALVACDSKDDETEEVTAPNEIAFELRSHVCQLIQGDCTFSFTENVPNGTYTDGILTFKNTVSGAEYFLSVPMAELKAGEYEICDPYDWDTHVAAKGNSQMYIKVGTETLSSLCNESGITPIKMTIESVTDDSSKTQRIKGKLEGYLISFADASGGGMNENYFDGTFDISVNVR
ncbi:MAG: hypothetical protein Q4G08_08565 [Capnocytophaga sp.]|nr:hypothetical protein [Capnocytophaga sp.]